ncbi:endonuclease [Niastella caeni]|uniref:Endonuclease n=1 Tax=Niastella caeni TaxID=2569763 RepID=A0A4S8I0F1_9BACT|nr:DNA-formamidopyrimidine glycosylase family protein [Niastella caeni]THU41573.1 endonuclease [Niastella caeni]
MPEGPSIVILNEAVQPFKGKTILSATGNSSIDKDRLVNQKVTDFKSWGKHFLICLPRFTLRIHFLLFGSYSVNEQTKKAPRLQLHFPNGDLYLYSCSIRIIEEDLDLVYDWTSDVLNENWAPKKARKKLKAQPGQLVCDALLDQNIFSGVGNIIKNEVLFRIKVHPENTIHSLPPRKLTELINEACNYSYDFLAWKKAFVLKKHWLVHTKKTCPRCNIPVIKKYLGKTNRRTFYCENCQVLYKKAKQAVKKKARKKTHKV